MPITMHKGPSTDEHLCQDITPLSKNGGGGSLNFKTFVNAMAGMLLFSFTCATGFIFFLWLLYQKILLNG